MPRELPEQCLPNQMQVDLYVYMFKSLRVGVSIMVICYAGDIIEYD